MKKFVMVILFLLVIVGISDSQTLQKYVVTNDDIQICFPYVDDLGRTVRQWYTPTITSIIYSSSPVGVHKEKAKLGFLTWEGLLQADESALGKAIIVIEVTSLPAINRRTMEFHFRVRVPDGSIVSEWSTLEWVTFIGKPGKPSRTNQPQGS